MRYSEEQKNAARDRFFQGETIPEISLALGIERRTLYNWRDSEKWMIVKPADPDFSLRQRLSILNRRENKTESELKELDILCRHIRELEKLRQKSSSCEQSTEANGRSERQKHLRKNDFIGIDESELLTKFLSGLFQYQRECWDNREERIRDILKSRQIGMTWYFAREAFADALLRGRNKIFISASRKQADQFRSYIRDFSAEWFNIELSGKDVIRLQTRHGTAELHFLSTNMRTAQSYHGDLYIDEYFWIPKFDELKDVAMGMASHSQWRITFFSTPSSKGSPGYRFWSGDEYNEQMKQSNRPLVIFPERAELRRRGQRCDDLHWRRVITIQDAEREGCKLFDIAELRKMFSPSKFAMLYECVFIDDGQSCFHYAELQKCLKDSERWRFYHPDRERPYDGQVWIGYDPSRSRDGACIVVLTAPSKFKGKFHILERIILKNCAWEFQAGTIRDLCRKYNVEYIGIDKTGPGSGVFEQVQRFFPAATEINYTLETKAKLVLKAQQIISSERLEWDRSYSDIAAGFLMIRRTTTQSGNITYVADRSDLTGHADAAWAIMHALYHEDLIRPEADEEDTFVI